jgi:hypothetical protein
MKKTILALSIGLTSFTALSTPVNAQNSKTAVAFNSANDFMPSIRKLASTENSAFLGTYIPDTKSINARAFEDFHGRFKKVDNAVWFSGANGGFLSYFIQDGYGDRVIYDKKGRWQYSLITFGEDKLPLEIRAEVKSTYFDMVIDVVEEVQMNEGNTYILNLEDKSNIKVISVTSDGEMKVLRDLHKQ